MRVRISRKWWISFVATLGLLTLVWVVGSAVARGSDEGSPIGPTGGFSATHTFTYQGRLLDGGQPANGYYDFIVTLWTSETVGTQIAACEDWTNPLNNHYVEDGIFTFHLQPTNAATRLEVFNGENRWIQVQVRPYDPLDVEPYTTLPRQPIAAAPYAFSLYPQAVISGTVEGGGFGDAALNIRAQHPWGGGPYATALYAQSNTSSAVRAVSGGTGVHAKSTFQYAVRGDVITGTGGFFTSDAGYGVYAESSGTEPWDYGGYFTADWGYGVYAVSEENMALRAEAGDVSGLMRPAGQWGAVGIGESGGVWGSSGDGVAIRGASDSGNLIELHDSSPPIPDRRFYVSNAGNVYADGAIHSTAETHLAINPFEIEATSELANNLTLSFLHHWLGYTEIENDSNTGSSTIYVPVHNFTQLLGSPLRLQSLEVCYRVDTASSYISQTRVYYANSSGGRTEILYSDTDRTSTSWSCYTVSNVTPAAIEGPLLVYFNLYFAGTGSGHTITIGQITATLVE